MTNTLKMTRIAAASLIALATLGATAAPVFAKEIKTEERVLIDERTTASIATRDRACDPADANSGFACRVDRDGAAAKYPSAPVNPSFGF